MGRASVVLAVSVAAVALASCGGSSDPAGAPERAETPPSQTTQTETGTTKPTPKPKATTITIRVVEGRAQGGIARPQVKKDERVVLVVRSDVADEVHLHGYDVSKPVRAGGTARLAFRATIPGRFEVELEERGVQIAELTVR